MVAPVGSPWAAARADHAKRIFVAVSLYDTDMAELSVNEDVGLITFFPAGRWITEWQISGSGA